jgi:ferredoxin
MDVYEELARHLDNTPAGFPRTESGAELRILRRLFTPEEAHVALHLTVIPEEPRVIARRAGLGVGQTTAVLETMERKGLIIGLARGGAVRYMTSQFAVGFWEAQVNRVTRGLAEDFEEYLPVALNMDMWGQMPQMRVIPVEKSIAVRTGVMPYEEAGELLRAAERFSVSNCICRQEREAIGQRCDRPMETCLGLGGAADMITRSGRGRRISREEAFDILGRAEDAGLVLQPSNTQKAAFICTCCGCCCAVLRSLKRLPNPAASVWSSFVAALNAATCQGCGTCETRCQMDALHVHDGTAALDAHRCIGCGLCVSTCPSGSLSLARKPESEQRQVPRDLFDNLVKVGKARGRFGVGELLGLQLRSKVDRLLTRSTGPKGA